MIGVLVDMVNPGVGCDYVPHGKVSNEEKESEVFEVATNSEPIVEVAPIAPVILLMFTRSIYICYAWHKASGETRVI